MDTSLEGRTALVTGAGRGIGRAIALALADRGAQVVAMARSRDQIEEVVREIEQRGGRALASSADLSDVESTMASLRAAQDHVGAVDILVNNAGNNVKAPVIALPDDPLRAQTAPGSRGPEESLTDPEWDSILDTHVRGPLTLIRHLAPGMLDRGFGRVINIGSSAVNRSPDMTAPYTVAKGTIVHLTRALAKEWAPFGVTVNAICPGHFRTEMTKALHDSESGQAWLRQRIPMRRAGDVEELGALTAHLASAASSFITGQTIYVDGGETL